jgi:hypothetical protein
VVIQVSVRRSMMEATRCASGLILDVVYNHFGPEGFDDSAVHPFLWLKGKSAQRDLLSDFAALWAWVDRLEALGEGQRTELESSAALAAAKQTAPSFRFASAVALSGDPQLGSTVRVAPSDYGFEPVVGELISLGLDHVSIARSTPETGDLVVHFPRWGYRVVPS